MSSPTLICPFTRSSYRPGPFGGPRLRHHWTGYWAARSAAPLSPMRDIQAMGMRRLEFGDSLSVLLIDGVEDTPCVGAAFT